LVNVPTGDAGTLTTTVIADHNGDLVGFEGIDTIRVIK